VIQHNAGARPRRNIIGKLLDRDTLIKAPGRPSSATASLGIGVGGEHVQTQPQALASG
jgi:hypothetical protein